MISVAAVACDRVASRFIRWGIGEEASHLAILFPEPGQVLHSTLSGGVHAEALGDFRRTYTIVDSVTMPTTNLYDEWRIFHRTELLFEHAEYDITGFIGFALAAAGKKFLGREMPHENPMDDAGRFLCVEVLYGFLDVWAMMNGQPLTLKDRSLGVMTPLACVRWIREALLETPAPFPLARVP